jgi:hypothetical protein
MLLFLPLGLLPDGGQGGGRPAEAGAGQNGPEVQGTFDLATVEDLALFFAEETIRRVWISPILRLLTPGKDGWNRKEEIERIRNNPPRADENLAVYPMGDKNDLSFVFDPDTRSLSCWERLVKKHGSTGMMGLTGSEMAAALNAVSARGRDRGGADFAYDAIRDALSLRLDFRHPPENRKRFYKEVRGLVAAQVKWTQRYLDVSRPIVEGRHPPGSATALTEGFGATLVLRHFSVEPSESQHYVERYLNAWDRPHGGMEPSLVSDRAVLVDQVLHAYIHFRGARNNAQGMAAVDATFRLVSPDNGPIFADLEAPIWRGPAPPASHLQIGEKDLALTLDQDEPLGTYSLEARVCDRTTSRCVELEHPFTLRSM